MRKLTDCPWLLKKVSADDPSRVYIDGYPNLISFETAPPKAPSLIIKIEPNVIIRAFKSVAIARGCEIKINSEIIDSQIGEKTVIHNSYVENSLIGNNCEIGWCAQIKRSVLGEGVKMKHQSYLGDAIIGDGCNIGHQASAANFSGSEKSKIIIGKNVFIGDNVKLVAPLKIGDQAYIADGTIRSNIPSHALVIGIKFNEKTQKFEEIMKLNRSFKEAERWIIKKSAD